MIGFRAGVLGFVSSTRSRIAASLYHGVLRGVFGRIHHYSNWICIVCDSSHFAGLSLHRLGSAGSLGRGPQGPERQGPQVLLGLTAWDVMGCDSKERAVHAVACQLLEIGVFNSDPPRT